MNTEVMRQAFGSIHRQNLSCRGGTQWPPRVGLAAARVALRPRGVTVERHFGELNESKRGAATECHPYN